MLGSASAIRRVRRGRDLLVVAQVALLLFSLLAPAGAIAADPSASPSPTASSSTDPSASPTTPFDQAWSIADWKATE